MKRLTYNEVVYEAFAGMCRILKKKEGVMNKSIAIDMGMDFAIFSKLLSKKRGISDKYRDKIFNFFNADVYERYAEDFKLHICGVLCLSDSSIAYKKITAKSYPELLNYLFYDYNVEDLTIEDDIRAMFIFYVKKFFTEILDAHSDECGGYEIVVDDTIHELEKKLGLPENFIIEIGCLVDGRWEKKIYILICPQTWNKGREIVKSPDAVEQAEYYMAVYLKEGYTESLLSMNDINDEKNVTAEFETFRAGSLCRKARQLAEMIFKNVCENNVIEEE